MLASHGNQDLVRCVLDVVVAPEFVGDRLPELDDPVHRGVLGETLLDSLDRRGLDVLGRVEVGLAGPQADDVASGPAEFLCPGGDGESGRGLDSPYAGGERELHESPLMA